ncbi:MAG: hypothetical protein CVV58_00645 [Tenericutes bacterium HGW-Tenericutes-3]|nr:MAG: hypothetical protein CVV58_00645 [Tenericutes bacterium HGW-Tenericutes-3]
MKKIVISLIMFIASFMLLTAVIFAWFTLTDTNEVQNVANNIVDSQVELDIEYGINGGGYESFDEPADLNAYLRSTLPGDQINVRVIVQNFAAPTDPDLNIDITMLNILASASGDTYNLTDFFYIELGTIYLNWYASSTDYYSENPYSTQNILLDRIDESTIMYMGLALNDYRFSNVFNYYMDGESMVVENNIHILDATPLPSGQIITIEFSIGFDAYTPDFGEGFQDGELSIDGLYTLFES